MGKASSSKKVARAARAGGSKARAAGERNFLFPSVLFLVVVLGIALVVYARDERLAEAEASPKVGDHIHLAYGFYTCGSFAPDVPEFTAPLNGGNHTHGDGLLHIHPFSTARSGDNANLGNWMADAGQALGGGAELSDTTLSIPTGDEFVEGETTCEPGEDEEELDDPIVQVAVWDRAQAAVAGEEPDRILTENLSSVHFEKDGMAFTIAFMPEGAEIPPPPSASQISSVSDDLGLDPSEIPEDLGGEGTTESDTTEPTADTEPQTTDTEPESTDPASSDTTEGE